MAQPKLLSLLCITKAEPHSRPFLRHFAQTVESLGHNDAELVIAADGERAMRSISAGFPTRVVPVLSRGYLETVLDAGVDACEGHMILRLDDDERVSPALLRWLKEKKYLDAEHWKFPRVHFWRDRETILLTPQLYPDHQTRCSLKRLSGGRHAVHAGSPHGGGTEAPAAIEHHKFLVRSYEDRRRIAQSYDRWAQGYGTGPFLAFSLPEDAYPAIKAHPLGTNEGEGWHLAPVASVEGVL